MEKRIVLVRHAESTNNDLYARTGGRVGREADPDLSDAGRVQARLVAGTLATEADLRNAPVWASPSLRAVATAAELVRVGTGEAIMLCPELIEGGGIYDRHETPDGSTQRIPVAGRPIAELARAAGDVPVSYQAGVSASWDGGFEDHDDIPARADALIRQHLVSGPESTVWVTHEWFTQHLIRAALGLPQSNAAVRRGWFRVPNASITELSLGSDEAELVRVGETHHLADAPAQESTRYL